MHAAPHPQQAERVRTLESYDILDTPREADYDEIVELVSEICQAPISVINLIDRDRQWFKAEVGLGVRETPLDTSLCSHVILDDDFVEIPDTLKDPRMADNPLCLDEPGLRFYAGARLLAPNGLPLGTLCVLDNEPRRLNELQKQTISVLSRQVMKQLDLRRALDVQKTLVAEADHRIKNSLQTLSSIVRLYGRGITDKSAVDALAAIERRINAVAALHEELQDGGSNLDMAADAYLARVADLLSRSAPDNIKIVCAADPVSLSASHASALGVIVSEFVANSIKHGFADGRAGRIDITFLQRGEQVVLSLQDNGLGEDANRSSDSTQLGSQLLQAAARQIDADLDFVMTATGARLTLTLG